MSGGPAYAYYDQYEQYYDPQQNYGAYGNRPPPSRGGHGGYPIMYQPMVPQGYGAYPLDPRFASDSHQTLFFL